MSHFTKIDVQITDIAALLGACVESASPSAGCRTRILGASRPKPSAGRRLPPAPPMDRSLRKAANNDSL